MASLVQCPLRRGCSDVGQDGKLLPCRAFGPQEADPCATIAAREKHDDAGDRSWEGRCALRSPCDHLVQFYQQEALLTCAVVRFVAAGLKRGEAAVIIATPDHVTGFRAGLGQAGLDVGRPHVERHQVVILDAEESLARFMVKGVPDRAAVVELVNAEMDRVRGAGFARVRLFGEMVEAAAHPQSRGGAAARGAVERAARRSRNLPSVRVPSVWARP
ncbi:MAG TPA: MEDS domain-containing protein [Solirubrobacterales bacterium]|nr:MEDS domain-containing protein [Solirubrobacterales bacterium]